MADWAAASEQHVAVEHVDVRVYPTGISMRSQIVSMLFEKTVWPSIIRPIKSQNVWLINHPKLAKRQIVNLHNVIIPYIGLVSKQLPHGVNDKLFLEKSENE